MLIPYKDIYVYSIYIYVHSKLEISPTVAVDGGW